MPDYTSFALELDALRTASNLRTLPHTPDDGKMVNLSSNDYLGLNGDAELFGAFAEEFRLTTASMSACSSRLLTGNHAEYARLETLLADLYDGREATVFASGYHANNGILPAIAGKRDLIIADKLVHASLIDGTRLSAATTVRFRHNDMAHLEALLAKHRRDFDRCFIVTESIFSMDGDAANLSAIVELKRRFDAFLYVDEAHAFGVRGERGGGLCEELGLAADVDILVGTFGKAAASVGAFAITNDVLKRYLVNHCRTLIFSTALPPACVAWTRFVVGRFGQMDERRQRLRILADAVASALGVAGGSHIVPYICGSNERAIGLANALTDNGFLVMPIRHPTVPKGTARLRFSLKADINPNCASRIAQIINQHKNDFPCNTNG